MQYKIFISGMKQFEITIKVEVLGYDELNSDEEQLALLAREATEQIGRAHV